MTHNDPDATTPRHASPHVEGITEHTGEDAARVARETEREAMRKGAPDPLEGLAIRVSAEKLPELAFDPPVIAAAANLIDTDPRALEALRRELRAAGVSIGRWHDAVAVAARDARRAARDAERERAKREAAERRETSDARREAERERREAMRAESDTGAASHFAEGDDGNGTGYVMEPGLTLAEVSTKRGEVTRTVLAWFSARIVADVSELSAPDAPPRRRRVLSVMCGGDRAPFAVEVPASGWYRGDWLEEALPARARPPVDRKLRAALLDGIGACSSPVDAKRYRFTGWTVEAGRPLYLHAGGAIGAEGEHTGVDVVPEGNGAAFRLPQGGDNAAPLASLAALLDVTPSTVALPVIALAFRAAMGPTRATVHVKGRPTLGKSTLSGLVASLFGPAHVDVAPASWVNDSAPGIFGLLASVGDALLFVDDLNNTGVAGGVDVQAKYERVVRAKYDGQGRNLRHVDGAARTDPRPRCAILSTGEVSVTGFGCASRVVSVDLDERPAPNLEAAARAATLAAAGDEDGARAASSLAPLIAKARDGELARAMAAFVQWYAPRYVERLPNLEARDRDAARSWGLGEGDRAAGLLGALAHGLEELFAFLGAGGAIARGVIDAKRLDALRDRSRSVLRTVAKAHGEHVSEEDPALRFCALVRDALMSGNAHVAAITAEGKPGQPKDPAFWGWREERVAGETKWRERGSRIGYLARGGREVFLDPGPSIELATAHAKTHPLGVDTDALGRALVASGVIVRTHGGKSTVQHRLGGGVRLRAWAVRPEALGYYPDEDDGGPGDGLGSTDLMDNPAENPT